MIIIKKKYFLLLIYFFVCILNSQGEEMSIDLVDQLKNNNLKLIIYYNNLDDLPLVPLSVNRIKNGFYSFKIEVPNLRLKKDVSWIGSVDRIKFIKSTDNKISHINTLCEFVDIDGVVLFNFTLGVGKTMLVNNVIVDIEKVLFKSISKYLPKVVYDNYMSNLELMF